MGGSMRGGMRSRIRTAVILTIGLEILLRWVISIGWGIVRMGAWIWWGMCGSGVGIGGVRTIIERRQCVTRQGLLPEIIIATAAAHGATVVGTSAALAVMGTRATTSATLSVSVCSPLAHSEF